MNPFEWNRKILIVDDEVDIAEGYKEIICPKAPPKIKSSRSSTLNENNEDKHAFQVDVANSYEQALELVTTSIEKNEPYTMGFFDVLLGPGKDGIELVKEIFNIDANMYAVFVTAYQDRTVDSIRNYLPKRSNERWDYLNKPLNDGELLQKARNYNALWNLQKEKLYRDEELNALRERILESERSTSIAAISRSVTHEFGNVLMQIMGKADISRKKTEEEMREALNVILDASVRANTILDRFKSAANGEPTNQKTNVYIHEIIGKCLELMEFQIKNSDTRVNVEKLPLIKLPINVTSFMQVFLNVMINAIHAMGDKGEISIKCEKNEDSLLLRICDSGPGIPLEILDKVLVPFFTTKGSKGSGLGLAICKEIIEIDHGGEFSIANKKVGGAEVKIILPTNDPLEES